MPRDEIRAWDAVAVEEDAIVAAARRNRTIADLRGAEADMLVPNVRERSPELGFPPRDHRFRRRTRAIVRNNHLEVAIVLSRQPAQRGVESIRRS